MTSSSLAACQPWATGDLLSFSMLVSTQPKFRTSPEDTTASNKLRKSSYKPIPHPPSSLSSLQHPKDLQHLCHLVQCGSWYMNQTDPPPQGRREGRLSYHKTLANAHPLTLPLLRETQPGIFTWEGADEGRKIVFLSSALSPRPWKGPIPSRTGHTYTWACEGAPGAPLR